MGFNAIDRIKIQLGDVVDISQKIDDSLKIINIGATIIEKEREDPRFSAIIENLNDLYNKISNVRDSVKRSQRIYEDIKLKFESPLLYWVMTVTKVRSHDI